MENTIERDRNALTQIPAYVAVNRKRAVVWKNEKLCFTNTEALIFYESEDYPSSSSCDRITLYIVNNDIKREITIYDPYNEIYNLEVADDCLKKAHTAMDWAGASDYSHREIRCYYKDIEGNEMYSSYTMGVIGF